MTLCMIVSLFSGMSAAFADGSAQLIVSTQTAKVGDEVTLSVSTANNPGVAVLTLGINYDEAKLELVGFENSGFTGWTVKTSAVWVGDSDSTYNGEILKLKFKVLDGASGKAEVSLRCGNGDAYNYNEEPISFEIVSGGVIIEQGHTHSYTEKVTAPTCTEEGYTTHTCACGNSYIDSYTNALGHSYSVWKQTKAPTCTEKGTEGRTCSRCNATETRDVAVLGHAIVHHAAKAATCTEKGWAAYDACSRCDYSTYKEIPATGHHHNAVVTEPTCTEKGYTTHTCACGDSYIDDYRDAYGHDLIYIADIDAKCTESGSEPYEYCDRCDYTTWTADKEVPALGHDYINGICSRCGEADPDYKFAPDAPELKITTSSGKPKVYWNEVDGAVKYWLYRSTDGVNFKYWDSTTKTTYTNKGAASGTKYYYRVKAVAVVNGNNVASANSSTKSLMTTLAKPSVSITTSGGKPKLTWNAVTGADKYYIYRSTDGKNFKYWESTTKTYYTNTGAKKNTRYYYKVKAVCASNSYANSAQSSTVSIKATK